jgi:class 3 adenylate cyclase
MKRWEGFAAHFRKFYELEKEVQSEESKRQAERIEQQKRAAEREKQQSVERAQATATRELLDLVLPASIATRMLAGEKRIADYFPNVSILFADIVGFTALATEVPPDVVIDLLNHVFDIFDEIIRRNGCEKIKTIGDGYMAVSGAPEECSDHAERIARAALEMMEDIHLTDEIRKHLPKGTVFSVRIGIHTGAAVCGVIGRERFVWDVYSDAVNTAARMETNGEPGRIHVSREFAWLLRSRQRLAKGTEEFHLEERGEVEIKGKGMMKTYFLEKA